MVKEWSKIKDLFKKLSWEEIKEKAFGSEEQETFEAYESELKRRGVENVKKKPDFSMYVEPNVCQRCGKLKENCVCDQPKSESWLRVGS